MESKKVTIYDIAERTGVSVGTVNRALSNKGRIKAETKQLILDTARAMGYKANVAAQMLRRNPIKIGVVLFCQVDEYVEDIHRGIRVAAAELEQYNTQVAIHKLPYTSDWQCCQQTNALLAQFEEQQYNGVVLFSSAFQPELQSIVDSIDRLTEKGISVATVANNVGNSKRAFHVGVDAIMGGRIAAEVLKLCCEGQPVAVITGSNKSEVNAQCVEGFMSLAQNYFPSIAVYEHRDDPVLVVQKTREMVEQHPDLKGVYMTTASSSLSCRVIREMKQDHLKIITTDILSDTYGLLKEGPVVATVFQDPYKQGKDVLHLLYEHISGQPKSGIYTIAPNIVFASNAVNYMGDKQS